jgi:hypothetical protein
MYTKEQIEKAWKLANDYGIRYFGATGSNAKTIKSDKKTNYLTHIMYLAPSDQAGTKYNVCPSASKGCRNACLFTAGRGQQESVKNARILRTKFWFEHREEFKMCVFDEIQKHRHKCSKIKKLCAIRLNGLSDIVWERIWPELFTHFKDVQFYDYTKIVRRMMLEWKLPPNYYLTFSRSESNQEEVKSIIDNNPEANIAVVFDELPKTWMGRKVINADEHDLRILDKKGVICGLSQKGDARKDNSGFVIRSTNITIKGKELQHA